MAGPTESIAAARNPDVAWAVEEIRKKLPGRLKAQRYYQGQHPLNFATVKFQNAFGELFQELADNLCDDVVNEPTDRLQIESWSGKAATAAQEWWDKNRGDARSGGVHQRAFRDADAFVIVWDSNNDGEAKPYVQDSTQMAVRYSTSDPDHLEVAAKCWPVGKGFRLNLYYPPANGTGPSRIEHWFSRGANNTTSGEKGIPQAGAFLPYQVGVEGDDDYVGPVEEHDHGMPVFHFPNGELGMYGQSVLADVYPLQDALNKSICDMMVAAEKYAQQDRWATGIEVVRDPVTGVEHSPWKDGKNLWWTKNQEATFGSFPQSELKGFLDQQKDLRLEIARKGAFAAALSAQSGGNVASGLALLVAEGKIVKRCKDRQRDWGQVWRELVAYALSWSSPGSVGAEELEATWVPPQTRDDQATWELMLIKKEFGVPDDVLLVEDAGYDATEVAKWAQAAEERRAQAMDAANAMAGGRVSAPPAGGPVGLPAPPVPPNGAAQPVPAGAG